MCSSASEQGANLFDAQPTGCLPLQPVGQPSLTLPTVAQTDGSSAVIAGIAATLSTSLALNGGSTPSLALLSGSPAIDYYKQGDSGALGTFPTTDQRATERPMGVGYDVGAFEYQPTPTPTDTAETESLADTGLETSNLYLGLAGLGLTAILGGSFGLFSRRRYSQRV
jgi:LPXTG-motif cell wall-anchored protein